MTKAIYPGTFDPITKGHLDIIDKSSKLFKSIEIVIGNNKNKKTLFTDKERLELIKKDIKPWKNVKVSIFHGLMINYLKKIKAQFIIRGLRAISDFEYELQIALTNKKLDSEAETIFIPPKENFIYLNSSLVKELASLGTKVNTFVTPNVARALKEKFKNK